MTTDDRRRHRVLLAGATGLVGRELYALLAEAPWVERLTALVRRPMPHGARHARVRDVTVDFDALDGDPSCFSVDQVFCALGTTMRTAGSQEAFWRVDHAYPLRIAQLARAHGARHFLLVSAVGADPTSRVFYSRVKGELERDLLALGFPALTIARPSVLEGERAEFRLGEATMRRLGFLVPGRWKPVHARQVARALVRSAHDDRLGVHYIENATLRAFPR